MEFLEAIDQGALPWFRLLHRPWLDGAMVALTIVGSRPVLAGVVILLDGALVAQRRFRTAAILTGIATFSVLLDWGIKALVQRPRPAVVRPLVAVPDSSSFPSGHALSAAAVLVGAALLFTSGSSRWRIPVLVAALFLAFLIGFSRLYLGVHYAGDVVAGWTAGLACALGGGWLDETIK